MAPGWRMWDSAAVGRFCRCAWSPEASSNSSPGPTAWPTRMAPGFFSGGCRMGGQDLYAFTTEPQADVDFEVANYFVSTHPDSPFTRALAVQLPTPDARYMLRNRELTIERATGNETRTVGDDELMELLASRFGLTVPPGTTFPDRPWVWGTELSEVDKMAEKQAQNEKSTR